MPAGLYSLLLISSLSACSHGSIHPETQTRLDAARDQILKLQDRVQELETRLVAMNDKINLESKPAEPPPGKTQPLTAEVVSPPAAASKAIPHAQVSTKPSFTVDEAIDRFREAKILFDSKRFPDAVLEFSEFIKNEPDHPLAAAAQYHIGLAYLRQKEYKLAEEELSRVLLTYPHSSHVPDSLLTLSEVTELLGKSAKATYFREKLQSQFPNSPQAKAATRVKAPVEETEPSRPKTAPREGDAG